MECDSHTECQVGTYCMLPSSQAHITAIKTRTGSDPAADQKYCLIPSQYGMGAGGACKIDSNCSPGLVCSAAIIKGYGLFSEDHEPDNLQDMLKLGFGVCTDRRSFEQADRDNARRNRLWAGGITGTLSVGFMLYKGYNWLSERAFTAPKDDEWWLEDKMRRNDPEEH